MNAWQVLCAAGLTLIVLELFTATFVLLPIGLACLLTAAATLFVESWSALLAILALNSVLVFAFFQKVVKPRFQRQAKPTGSQGMVGKEAVVTEAIGDGGNGYVKLYGDTWQATSAGGRAYAVGDKAIIRGTDGNKVVVD